MTFSPPLLNDAHRWAGRRVGLLGGSFNPPHEGHMHIARVAMAKFGLDAVWWIVTPQNPLKHRTGMAPYAERFAKVQEITARTPRHIATHLEHDLGTTFTYETVTALRARFSRTQFLWICGMDNAHIFHHWDRWQSLIDQIPVVFIARPPAGSLVQNAPIRMQSQIPQYHETQGRKTDLTQPGIFWIQGVKMLDVSSTKIRNINKL